ncbi:MAG: ABC transporter ATP-binding protein [Acholeplasmataceae bacterium]|nr:ABC transporter ATP-binding protein [Acholeplasmataceae bacterium]
MPNKIEMNNITKIFGSLYANDDVTLEVLPGEIHALLGENGAGKSTLMSILFGLYQPEHGNIKIDGEIVEINNPNDANRLGIGMVHQHFKLVETFTVLDNIILGAEDTKNGLITYDHARAKIQELIDTYHLKVDLDKTIKDLTVGQQQRVEILKMLYRDADILIFDEPTAVLTPQEIHELMNIMKGFAKEGKTIVLITHKLNEIKMVANRCTVLRRGKVVGTVDVSDVSVETMAEMMVGREVTFTVDKPDKTAGEIIFEVTDALIEGKGKPVVNRVNLSVRAGEIVGLAGIDGNGQTELVRALTGLTPLDGGHVILNGVDITQKTIRKRYEAGMSHIPEDRQKHGVILDFDLASNLILQNFYQPKFQKRGFLRFETIYSHASDMIDRFDIRSEGGGRTMVRSMSGGNQQKAIVGREIARKHNVLIAVQPTRGLDVGAIEYIHSQLLAARDNNEAVLLVSLEIDEIMNLSDRILVIYEGEIVGDLDPKQITVNELGLYMSGAKRRDVRD